MTEIGIITGTGVYDPNFLENVKKLDINTPFGKPSDDILTGIHNGRSIALLFRHGSNHSIPPHKINSRANIWALKELDVKHILATNAVGSLKEEYKAGNVVIADQFIDVGKQIHTFYDGPKVYHVSMADPFCPELRNVLITATKNLGIQFHEKGTYIRINGPQFSTRSASHMYRQFADIIGMNVVPESILSRELGICYSTICTITDYDCWAEKPVSFTEIKETMSENVEKTKKILTEAIPIIPKERNCSCEHALKDA